MIEPQNDMQGQSQPVATGASVTTPLNLGLIAALVLITAAGVLLIPDAKQLPVRWAIDGQVAATLSRNFALAQMPIATAAVWVLVYAVNRWGNSARRAGAAATLRLVLPGLTTLFLVIQLLIVLIGAGVPVPYFQAH
jgi:hypothetical protein